MEIRVNGQGGGESLTPVNGARGEAGGAGCRPPSFGLTIFNVRLPARRRLTVRPSGDTQDAAMPLRRPSETAPAGLRRFTALVAGSTLFLIFAGAMVTSTGSGLAVPDWPLSFGRLMPPMVAGVFYEHGHRMIAATVGLMTMAQAVWLQAREARRPLRILGWCAAGAVGVQAMLGGATVLLRLPPPVSIGHAATAQLVLCLNVAIAFFSSNAFRRLRAAPAAALPAGLAAALTLALYGQAILGAVVRHFEAALAIPDFPLSFGRLLPPAWDFAVAVDFAHRVGAGLVAGLVIGLLWRAGRGPLRLPVLALCALVGLQVALGAEVVWGTSANAGAYHSLAGAEALRHAAVASAHVVVGAVCLSGSLLITLAAWTRSRPAPRLAPASLGVRA
jgi:cytochrome c oxidase assembly protein subunit 15